MIYKFRPFELDTERRELRKRDEQIALQPKAFSVLVYLIQRSDRLVSKAELLEAFWPTNVGDAPLQTTISLLRKALNDDRKTQSIIKTYHGQGFRFVAELAASLEQEPTSIDEATTPPLLSLREQRLVAVMCIRLCKEHTTGVSADQHQKAIEEGYAAAKKIVEVHQGSLLHMMVDGFTAVFGLDKDYEDCARRAVYCSAELAEIPRIEMLAKNGLIPAFSIDTGNLKLANGAEGGHWEPPGAIERNAILLAEKAKGGEIILSENTRIQLGDEIKTETIAEGYRLVSISEHRAGIPSKPQVLRSRFVGRGAEMAFLTAGIEELAAGRGHAVVISGPPGVGKSRLVSEFIDQLDTEVSSRLIVNCLPSLQNTPLAPIRVMCSALFSDLPAGLVQDPIDAAILRELLNESGKIDPVLFTLSEHHRKQRSWALVVRLLQEFSKEAPLAIVFEDVHWIDASSREVLDAIVQSIDRTHVILVMTTRPVEQLSLSEAVIQLSPLSRNDSIALLRTITKFENLDESSLETLVQRAGGNPFFLEELALAAQSGADPLYELPDTVHAVISGRIAALEDKARALLYVISVIGSPAPARLTARILGQAPEEVNAGVDQLVGKGFLRKDETGFSVRHMLISETAYALVAPEDRKRLHQEIADCLQAEIGAEAARPEILAWHFQEAGNAEKAISHWISACRSSLRRFAHKEAATFAKNGIKLVETELPDAVVSELDLQLCLALALTSLRGFAAAEMGAAYFRAGKLNRTVHSAKAGFQVGSGLSIHHWVLGELSKSLVYARELLILAESSENPSWKIQAHASAGEVLVHTGRLTEALEHLNAGVALIESASPDSIPAQNAAVACTSYAGWAASLSGKSQDARQFLEASGHLSKIMENPFAEATHYALCAGIFMYEMDPEKCLEFADCAIALCREHDFPFWLSTGLIYRGWALGQTGEFSEALDEIERGISIFEATGAGVQLVNWYGLKAETLMVAGKFEDGLEAARIALKHAEQTNDMYFAPRVHAIAAELYQWAGDPGKANAHAEQAQSLMESFGMKAEMITFSGVPKSSE